MSHRTERYDEDARLDFSCDCGATFTNAGAMMQHVMACDEWKQK